MRCSKSVSKGNYFPKWPKKSSQEGSHLRFAKWNGVKNMKLFLLGMKPSNIQSENHLTAGSSTKIVILFPVVFFLNRAVPRAAVSAVPEMWHDFRHAFGHRELGCLLLHPTEPGGASSQGLSGNDFAMAWCWLFRGVMVEAPSTICFASPSRLFRSGCEAFIQTARKIYENIQNNVYDLSSEAQREDHSTDRR